MQDCEVYNKYNLGYKEKNSIKSLCYSKLHHQFYHCFLKPIFSSFSLIFPQFSVWYVPCELFDLQHWNGGGVIRVPKSPDELLMMQGRPGSLLLWLSGAGGATAAAHRLGSEVESKRSEKCGCCGCGCTVLKSWPWAKDLTLLRCRTSLRLLMLMAL